MIEKINSAIENLVSAYENCSIFKPRVLRELIDSGIKRIKALEKENEQLKIERDAAISDTEEMIRNGECGCTICKYREDQKNGVIKHCEKVCEQYSFDGWEWRGAGKDGE